MIKKIINGKPILYLIASIIPFLTISIFVADLIYSVFAILFLLYLTKNDLSVVYKNKFFLLSIIFYFVSVASSIFSYNILFSLKSSLPFLRIIIFLLLLTYLITNNKNLTKIFYNFFIFTFILLITNGFIEYYYEYNELINSNTLNDSSIRLKLFFSDEEKLGSFLVRFYGLFLALHIKLKNKSKYQNLLFFIITLLTSIIILLSGERNALFLMILFFLICLILLDIKFKFKTILLTLISISFLLLLSSNSNLSKRIIFDKNNQFNFSKDQLIIFTPQHTAHYKTALKMFLDKPYLGHGPKMFRIICSDEKYNSSVNNITGCTTHPHNTYIQLLAETGIIGTLIFSSGFIFISYSLIKQFLLMVFYRKRKLSNYQIALSATVLLTFWPFSPAGNFFNNWLLIVYSLPLGFYINEFFKYKINT